MHMTSRTHWAELLHSLPPERIYEGIRSRLVKIHLKTNRANQDYQVYTLKSITVLPCISFMQQPLQPYSRVPQAGIDQEANNEKKKIVTSPGRGLEWWLFYALAPRKKDTILQVEY